MEVSLNTWHTGDKAAISFITHEEYSFEQFTNINDLYNMMVKELKQQGVTL